MGVPSG